MKQILLALFITCLTALSSVVKAQNIDQKNLDSLFTAKGEVYFTFSIQDREDIHALTRIMSIDNVKGHKVYAYANRKEFSEFLHFNLAYTILQHPGTLLSESEINPYGANAGKNSLTDWNFYPSYQQYLDYMAGFVAAYPDICKIDTVGLSGMGRLILALKISKNVGTEEAEPQFLHTSSIHGDETTGYVLMLHLIDYLLSNYGTNADITNLINTTEILINPLANPDGTYHGGNSSVNGAVRYNASGVDINRNFPDPKVGQHPDGNAWQVETVAWMAYAGNNHFTMSANFHGGAEVFNYPWDTWVKLNADDDWWNFVGREWADTVHEYGPVGYFDDLDNGVTNGNAWYEINGGRQDYMNYFHHCREVTLEISNIKLLPASQLLPFWDYNYRSFLNYIKESHYGFNGFVTDTVTDEPIAAKVFIQAHDKDNTEVYSRPQSGYYARPVFEGTYNVTFSASGYFTKTINNVSVSQRSTTNLNVQLRPLTYDAQDKITHSIMVFPNPTDGRFYLRLPDSPINPSCSIQIINMLGSVVHSQEISYSPGISEVEVDVSILRSGLYFLKFNSGYRIYLDKLVVK